MTNVVNGAPAYLAPDWRYAGDGWSGANALTYVVWAVAPVYAADGITITTPGVPQNLTGYTVTGTIAYRSRCAAPTPNAPPALAATGAVLNPAAGTITLSLTQSQTVFPRQRIEDWGNPQRALLEVQPRVVDANGVPVTVGLQPLFVF